MKRSRVNAVSARGRTLTTIRKRECAGFRSHFMNGCWFCRALAAEVHHIAGRGTIHHESRENYILACRSCHAALHRLPWAVKYAVQLAAKRRIDPNHYDRSKILSLSSRCDSAVTEQEVDDWVRILGGTK